MPVSTPPHSSPSLSVSPFSLPLAPEPETRDTSVFWRSSCYNKPLPPLPEEAQEEEVYNVRIVNHRNLDDDGRITVKHPDPEQCVQWIEEQEMTLAERAIIEGLMGDFQTLYSLSPPAVVLEYKDDKLSDYQGEPSLRLLSYDESESPDSTSSLTEPCPSPATLSTTLPSIPRQSLLFSPQHECFSPSQSSCLERIRLCYTHSQNPGPEQIPSSLVPPRTVESPPRLDAIDAQKTRHSAPAVATSPTQSSSRHRKRPISRPSVTFELAGYKPKCGPSPLLADQATAHHVYRAIKQHMTQQLKAQPDRKSQLEYIRLRERQRESRREDRNRENLAVMNAAAARDFKAAEQDLGMGMGTSPGNGRRLIPKRVFDNSAWQVSAEGHAERPSPPTPAEDPQLDVVGAAQIRRGRQSYTPSINVYGSSPLFLPPRTPSPPLGNGSASSGSSDSEKSARILRTPTMFSSHGIDNITVRSNGSPPRPLVYQRIVVQKQWKGPSETLPSGLAKSTRRSKRVH